MKDTASLAFSIVFDHMLLDNLIKLLSLHVIEKADVKVVQQDISKVGFASEVLLPVVFGRA